jgi:hypothetical protein
MDLNNPIGYKSSEPNQSPFIMNPYRFAVDTGATYGYYQNGSSGNVIDRYSFATDGDATDVGDATVSTNERGASSDIIDGYSYVFAGGPASTIERHQNSSSASGAGVGDLTNGVRLPSCSESSTHGYRSGGWA